ncbi:zinc finger protein, putative [Bodo saltans]|uniref:Zinc finger protein, putative n=1 Tax=Bodo saltans TaxID=75058 RepID=A0A0S4IWE1_BODSA|nr:zinc finger protein, putative [Bodo saltans]|eukprot:CUG04830.1 zinc finger protein, putative [Bodo saltans]
MVLFSQVICSTCRKILTFPLGAISCRCRNCQTINPTVHMEIPCSCCGSIMLTPPNTTSVLCPCCTTVTEIPVDLLPPIPEPVNVDGEDEKSAKTIYVELPAPTGHHGSPAGRSGARVAQGPILVATKIL